MKIWQLPAADGISLKTKYIFTYPNALYEIVPLSSVEFRAPLVRPPRFRAVDAQKKPKEFYVLNDDIYENY